MAQTYVGGGKLFVKAVGAVTFIEIGLVQDMTMTVSVDKKECNDYSGAYPEIADEVIVKKDTQLKFRTRDISADTLKHFLLASVSAGDTYTGTDLAASTVTTIKAGQGAQFVGQVKFVSEPARGKARVYLFHKVALTPESDLALIKDDFVDLSFSGKAQKDANGDVLTITIDED